MQSKIYVWEIPVRFTHWLNFLCMLILSFTGVYIANPFLIASSTDQYLMGWVRFIHFVAAYVLIVDLGVRIYWSFVGNKYATWHALFPFDKERIRKLKEQMSFYALIRNTPPEEIGHTPLAGIVYFLLFVITGVSALTGFALYSLYNPGGVMYAVFGRVFSLFSIPATRLIHHSVMWLILCFTILHLYIGFFLNAVERNGLLGSIFDGYKYIDTMKTK